MKTSVLLSLVLGLFLLSGCATSSRRTGKAGAASADAPALAQEGTGSAASNDVTTVTRAPQGSVTTTEKGGTVITTVRKNAGAPGNSVTGGGADEGGAPAGAGHGPLFYFYVVLAAVFVLWLVLLIWHRIRAGRQTRVVRRRRIIRRHRHA